jgi:hypothetical protein
VARPWRRRSARRADGWDMDADVRGRWLTTMAQTSPPWGQGQMNMPTNAL